ncbi:MAG: hypothetical protein WCF16_00410 [Alphaproteobacteria bacterium]
MPDPKKLTEQSTLADLREQRELLDVTTLTVMPHLEGGRACIVMAKVGGLHVGQGATEAEAIEAALSSLRVALLPEPLRAIAEGRTWPPLFPVPDSEATSPAPEAPTRPTPPPGSPDGRAMALFKRVMRIAHPEMPTDAQAIQAAEDETKRCPKCGAGSGNDWTQCNGVCPVPGSPHYRPPIPEFSYIRLPNNHAKVTCTCGWEDPLGAVPVSPFDPAEALAAASAEHPRCWREPAWLKELPK